MKTRTIILTIVLCAFIVVSCTNKQKQQNAIMGSTDSITSIVIKDKIFLYEKGLQLTLQMQQLANDKKYIEYCSHSKGINEKIEDIARQKYNLPKKVFAITDLQKNVKIQTQSNDIKPLIFDRLLRSIPSQLNAQSGTNTLAATSMLLAEDVFHYQGLKNYILYLFLYNGNYHSMVLYCPAKDDIVRAYSYFVEHTLLNNVETINDVKDFFAKTLNLEDVKVLEDNLIRVAKTNGDGRAESK